MIGAVQGFSAWRRGLTPSPAIASLHARGEEIRRAELARIEAQWEGLSEADRERLEALTKGIVNKLLHEPTVRARAAAEDGDALQAPGEPAPPLRPRGADRLLTAGRRRPPDPRDPALAAGAGPDRAGGRARCARPGTRPRRCRSRRPATAGAPQDRAPAPDRGLFVKELEEALLDGRADLAVHSAKDLPGDLPEGLAIVAVPPREDPRDVLVGPPGGPRRAAAGRARRDRQPAAGGPDPRGAGPTWSIVPIRGNVGTRLDKLARGEADALVLAAAGLRRLGLWPDGHDAAPGGRLAPRRPGQGLLAVEARAGDAGAAAAAAALDDPAAHACLRAERAFLAGLGGGCMRPVGALCEPAGGGRCDDRLRGRGDRTAPGGERAVREGPAARPRGPRPRGRRGASPRVLR